MKYRDLIEKLLPFADEEINMSVSSKEEFYSLYSDDPEYGDRKKITHTTRFYHPFEDNNDLIVAVEQSCDKESFENIGEAKFVTY